MRKALAISATLNLALLVVLTLRPFAQSSTASAAGVVALKNGDANGDDKIDVSDAIYLLSWLFSGGPGPVDFVDRRPPATGQAKCYDSSGQEIECTSNDFPGQDGFYQTGCSKEGRFVDNGDGTITDRCTGLMWQKEFVSPKLGWQDGLRYCEDLGVAGFTDWRLPNIRELQSILDYGIDNQPKNPAFIWPKDKEITVWSSTSHTWSPDFAMTVEMATEKFGGGYISTGFKPADQRYVLAVRAGL